MLACGRIHESLSALLFSSDLRSSTQTTILTLVPRCEKKDPLAVIQEPCCPITYTAQPNHRRSLTQTQDRLRVKGSGLSFDQSYDVLNQASKGLTLVWAIHAEPSIQAFLTPDRDSALNITLSPKPGPTRP